MNYAICPVCNCYTWRLRAEINGTKLKLIPECVVCGGGTEGPTGEEGEKLPKTAIN